MASEKQQELFHRLFEQRNMPDNQAELEAKFKDLPQTEASRWIEKALERPAKEDSGAEVPF